MARPEGPTARNWLEYAAVLGAGYLLSPLPAPLAAWLASIVGVGMARLAPVRRSVVMQNLRIAFGDSIDGTERRRLCREAYRTLALFAVETLMLQRRDAAWVQRMVPEIEGREHVDALAREGRSWIGVTPHFGNWELLGARGAQFLSASTLAKPLHNPLLTAFAERTRGRHGLRIIWTDSLNPPRQILKALREKNQVVNILPDQDMRHEGIFVPYFGRMASTTAAPAFFSIRTGAPIVPTFLVRVGLTRHRMVFSTPIDPAETAHIADADERVVALTRRYLAVVEDMIRLYPAQYFWFHRRWKTRPEQVAAMKEKQERRRRRKAEKAAAAKAQHPA